MIPASNSGPPVRLAIISLVVTFCLLALKLVLGLMSDSIAVLSDAIDSASDLLAAIAVVISIVISARPPDAEHSYGHGKVEGLSATVSAGVVGLGGGFVVWQALRRLVEGSPEINVPLALSAPLAAFSLNLVLAAAMRRVSRQKGSLALASEATHLQTNVVQSIAVIIALTLVGLTGQRVFDPVVALGLALYMWWMAYTIVRRAIDEIMDVSLPEEEQRTIRDCLLNCADGVRGFHQLRTRKSGLDRYADVHVVVDADTTVSAAHAITDALENSIHHRLPRLMLTIHIEPEDGHNCIYDVEPMEQAGRRGA